MRYFIAAAALASFVAAQDQCLSAAVAIPACGLGCITPVAADLGCELTDFACQCQTQNVAAIQSSAQECVISACGGVETALQVQSAGNAVCECASSAGAGGGSGSMMPSSSDAMSTGDMESSMDMSSLDMSSMDMGSMSMTGGDMPTETGSSDATGSDMSMAPSSAAGGSDTQSSVSPGAGNTVAVAGSISGVMGGLLALIAAL